MKDEHGTWVGLGLGDVDPKIAEIKAFMRTKFASYASDLNDSPVYGEPLAAAVTEMQTRYGLPATGVLDYATQVKMGFVKTAPAAAPIMFTVEGHLSDMWAGPAADTATLLEREGRCRHQPIGYNNGALPFDNASGINELARLVGSTVLDNGTPFPAGTPWALGVYSQGAIIGSYFYYDYLQPGQSLDWRLKDLRGVLAYGNPCRQTDSVAPWARPWVTTAGTHGLDPYRRFGLPDYPAKPDNWVDVYREGDIFAQNGDDKASEIKAAVYQAVVSLDLFSNPFSLAAQVAELFSSPIDEVIGMVMAMVSGVTFLAGQPNPHYDPYDIGGGVDWMRHQLEG